MTVVCITGMHRSGTSMIARLLNICGLYLGAENDLLPPASDNLEGFWENRQFMLLNDDLLSELGGGWDYPPAIDSGWEKSHRFSYIIPKALELLQQFSAHGHWGWKDPRNSLTFPFWKERIPSMKVVICLRNPLEVANSLMKRNYFSPALAFNLWFDYNQRILSSSEPENRIITHYDSYFRDPYSELMRILKFLEMEVSEQHLVESIGVVSPPLRHNESTLLELMSKAPSKVIDLYQKMSDQTGEIVQFSSDVNPKEQAILVEDSQGKNTAEKNVRLLSIELIRERKNTAEKKQFIHLLTAQVAEKEGKVQALTAQVIDKEQTIAAILDSSSWKLTRPWRAIVSLARSVLKPVKEFVRRLAVHVYRGMPMPQYRKSSLKDFAFRYLSIIFDESLADHAGQSAVSMPITLKFPPEVIHLLNTHEIEQLIERIIPAYATVPSSSPQVSIVIPVYNNLELTLKCLLSIKNLDDKISYEVIVADDNSNDATQNVLERCVGIRYLRNEDNLGFLQTCNKAVSCAAGQYIVLLNNDTIVLNGWLDNLYETFSQIADVGMVGSKLIFPRGELQEAGGIIWADGSGKNYGWNDDPRHYIYNYVRKVDFVSGASMMLPKSLWESLGGFDLRYSPAYYEDVDLAFRLRQAGYKVIYQPFSEVIHIEGASNGTDLTVGIKSYQVINKKKFFDTWHDLIVQNGSPAETSDIVQRERFPKGRVLYIDDVTTQPDQNAGAVLSECYMTSLRDDGYAVTFLPHFDTRFSPDYTPALQKRGIECVYRPYYRSMAEYLKQFGHSFDYVVISRASVAEETIDLVKKYAPQAKVIFNTIDLHFMRLDRAARLSKKTEDQKVAERIRRIELDTITKADCTLVVSNVEADLLANLLPQSMVRVVPFPADVFNVEEDWAERQDIVYLGGFKHPANADAVLYFVQEIWPRITEKLPNVKFVIAGPDAPPEIQNLSSETVVVRGFVKDLGTLFSTAKLLVAPIRYGAGIKGKVITSLGYGVPCIATSIAAEGIGLTHNENVLIADTPSEFVEAVLRVFNTPQIWRSLSSHGVDFIQRNYARAVIAAKLLAVFDEL
jgi:O-antigen biosynthesis protein